MEVYTLNKILGDLDRIYSIHPHFVNGGDFIERHTHEFIEIMIVIDGHAYHEGSGGEFQLESGNVFVIWPGEWHAYQPFEDEYLYHYNILIDVDFFQRELMPLFDVLTAEDQKTLDISYWTDWTTPWTKRKQHLTASRLKGLEYLLRDASDHCRELNMNRARAKNVFWELMLVISESAFAHSNFISLNTSPKTTIDRVDWVIEYIRSNCEASFTLKHASRLSDMKPTTFAQVFKRRTGQTVIEFRNRVRLERATQYLQDPKSNKLIAEIALSCGFLDISFFNTLFKNTFGVTPREYRNSKRIINK